MFLIKESDKRKNSYCKYLVDDETDKKHLIQIVNITTATREFPKREYTILYDSKMNPIHDAFEFINYEYLTSSPNSKVQAVTALRLLYSFLELLDLNLETITDNNIKTLKYFLKGYSPYGEFISVDLSTERSSDTVNKYLATYRKYLTFLGLTDSPLHKVKSVTSSFYQGDTQINIQRERYIHNEKANRDKGVPKYISLPDYHKIIKLIDKEYTERERCIVRLMFEGGLRIGEVLGLTSEDVRVEKFYNKRTGQEFESGVIYIRNRITDKPYQLCKGRRIPTTRRDYLTRMYKKDVKKAFVSVDLVDAIYDYINNCHDSFVKEFKKSKETFDKNYKKYTITDIVDKKANIDDDGYEILDENHYIFINSIGKPIHKSSWNKTIREIYKKCNIKVDDEKRENNLNHRFRHGFAMFLVQYKKIKIEDLMRLMRHSSITSTEVYYRPTDDDVAALKEDFSKTLIELLPIIAEFDFTDIKEA